MDIDVQSMISKKIYWRGKMMMADVSTKFKYREAILNQIKKEINPSENDIMLIQNRLCKATLDELERTYEAFERFGVKVVMDLVRQ